MNSKYTKGCFILMLIFCGVCFSCHSPRGDRQGDTEKAVKRMTNEQLREKLSLALDDMKAKAGCAGMVVSHHHGMIQYAVPPLMVVQDILSATGGSVPVFVDCGIESGMDAYKCLALGAKAVSVGRHLMPFLKEGAESVARRIDQMTAELAGVMARTGVGTLEEMDASVIHRRAF